MVDMKKIKVKYIGEYYKVSLEKGKVYDALVDSAHPQFYAIVDESGEEYGFPAEQFEIVEE